MRALLDIRKTVAEQIAYHNAHRLPYDMPPGLRAPLRRALQAKIAECQAALAAIEEGPPDR